MSKSNMFVNNLHNGIDQLKSSADEWERLYHEVSDFLTKRNKEVISLKNELKHSDTNRALAAEEDNKRLQENLKEAEAKIEAFKNELYLQYEDSRSERMSSTNLAVTNNTLRTRLNERDNEILDLKSKLEKLRSLHNMLQESYNQVYDERELLKDTIEAIDIIRGRERKIVQEMKDEGDDLTTPYAPC